jgi:exopolyphosphatase/guanosine-5'-triphosphate,3'-diphosphate pyrophosphatase
VRRLERHLEGVLGPTLDAVCEAGALRAIGTSGTINTLVVMARSARAADPDRIHGATIAATQISRLRRAILRVGPAQRAELRGMDAKRVDLMPAAAVLVDFLLRRGRIKTLSACAWALREGVLLELARPRADQPDPPETIRRRSIEALAARWMGENRHGRQVARLALALFDAVGPQLGLGSELRELLEYGALVHDIGHVMDRDRHHRHGAYLVRNAELLGFGLNEIEFLAHLVRTHRKQAPKSASPELRTLPPRWRRNLRGVSAVLRVADALDRTHVGVVKSIEISHRAGRWVVEVDARGRDAELELWAAERRAELLGRLLDQPVMVRERPLRGTRRRRRH